MRKDRIKRSCGLAAIALALTVSAHAGRTLAYFTDYVSASGSAAVSLSFPDTEIHEKVENWTKIVTVENTGDCDCYVRVRAYAGSSRTVAYIPENGWVDGSDGYYYYDTPLAPGEVTESFKIQVPKPAENDTEEFNVIVVSEHTFVLYDEDGAPDWKLSFEDAKKGE